MLKTLPKNNLYILLMWLGMNVISLFSRYYFPIDETRYVTVAWNMWLDSDYLVPHLNGFPYSHKPPLLFWLINIGWKIFGVNDWWPRLVPSFFALGSVFITQRIALRLWPARPAVAVFAGWFLMGSMLWTVFTTATMFDMLVAFFTALGVWGVIIASQSGQVKGWTIIVCAIGGGLLAKGPTIYLQLIPLALLAPFWITTHKPNWKNWYLGLAAALLAGSLLCLLWAVPAGIAGGAHYQHEIFMGQTTDRMGESAPHIHPWWWYGQMLPLILMPWIFVLPFWKAIRLIPGLRHESGIRLGIFWIVPVFIAFSLIAGKQAHYLLPLLLAVALLAARGLDTLSSITKFDKMMMAGAGLTIGLVILLLPHLHKIEENLPWIAHNAVWAGLLIAINSIGIALMRSIDVTRFIRVVSLFSTTVVAIIYIVFIGAAGDVYDLRTFSGKIKKYQDSNIPLAYLGKYHGQFNFIGRLTHSPESIHEYVLSAWFEAHPDGIAIVFFGKGDRAELRKLGNCHVLDVQHYRGGMLGLLNQQNWAELLNSQHEVPFSGKLLLSNPN